MRRLLLFVLMLFGLLPFLYGGCGGGSSGNTITDDGENDPPPIGSKMFFSADASNDGMELWSYDGINAPSIVANINTAWTRGSSPRDLVVFQDKLYFTAFEEKHGRTLWCYDEINGAEMVADIDTNTPTNTDNRETIYNLTVFDGKLYFTGDDTIHNKELWVYDGFNPPSLVKDIVPGSSYGSAPRYLTVFKDKLYFNAQTPNEGSELWAYAGTGDPYLVADMVVGPDHSLPFYLTVFKDALYYNANSGGPTDDIWAYNGTGNPYHIQNAPGQTHTNPKWFAIYNDELYFQARTHININGRSEDMGDELWKLDGTNPPEFVADMVPGSGDSSPSWMTTCNGNLYFQAGASVNDYDKELWVYDGVSAPKEVSDMILNSTPTDLFCYKKKLYFNADEDIHGSGHLWVYDEVNPAIKISDLYSIGSIRFPRDYVVFP